MSGYTKLFSSIIASTIWREPNHVRCVWVTMLAMSDKNGIVEASIPGLADMARVTVQECEEALARFREPDPYSRTKDHDGRRIADVDGGFQLLNHAKYRDMLTAEDRREYQRQYRADYRAKGKDRHRPGDQGPQDTTNQHLVNNWSTLVNFGQSGSAGSIHTDTDTDTDTKAKKKGAKWPTLPEALAAAAMSGITPTDAERFWNHFEASGWIDKNGNPIVSWQHKLRSWGVNSQSRPAEVAHHAAEPRPTGTGERILQTKELERVETRIQELRSSARVNAIGDRIFTDSARAELQTLKAKREELKQKLGFSA